MENLSALFTDFYELTMAQGYLKKKKNRRAVFEMFFRKNPFKGGYSIFAGLETLLSRLKTFRFTADDIAYLRGLNFFDDEFLEYLKDFRFSGDLYAMDEGSVIFPQEPLIRVDGKFIECQIIEGLVLNIINFQSLIATKTARVYLASGKGGIMEFGLRRAQGPDGAMSASRAAIIGGALGTSNTLAAKEFGVRAMGTMAHSWVMSFASEEEAFRAYAELYPVNPVFLIDTYDTLKSGVINAIKVGREIIERGGGFGVRLDSGDMHFLSQAVRRCLDEAGCGKASIAVSNDLDEHIISTLVNQGAPINSWGVGTRMVTGGDDASFTGVYKLTAHENESGELIPAIKFSDNPEKTTNPAVKQVLRLHGGDGMALADVLVIDNGTGNPEAVEKLDEGKDYTFYHPSADYRQFCHTLETPPVPMLKKRIEHGEIVSMNPPLLLDIQKHCASELETIDARYKRLLNPHIYKVSITPKLRDLKLGLIKNCLGDL
ncbi:MAG: nicotinate phosphoribosyltransferase [Spirochaetaceae bacterium]|jgi:nicotinate phosphoribosyltransferase|nr:nicotinate phosphoribosyltransferase [Spirochaetaceae bacterium]